jgi:hypothetical protein
MKPTGLYHSNLIDDDWPEIGVVVNPVRRICSRLSLIFVVAAIGADTVGKSHVGAGLRSTAKRLEAIFRAKDYAEFGLCELAIDEFDDAAILKEAAHQEFHRAGLWGVSGMALFVFALGSFGLSRRRGEGGSAVAFVVLAIAYVLWLLPMV